MRKLPGQETRTTYHGIGIGVAVFEDGTRKTVSYDVKLLVEVQDGHPFSSTFVCRVWDRDDEYFCHRSIGKTFVLELKDGCQLSLSMLKTDGTAGHIRGIAEGFPGVKG